MGEKIEITETEFRELVRKKLQRWRLERNLKKVKPRKNKPAPKRDFWVGIIRMEFERLIEAKAQRRLRKFFEEELIPKVPDRLRVSWRYFSRLFSEEIKRRNGKWEG